MNAQYKIFIIDEVHMLTTQAFNALLRTLEEPPKHGKFILATTDIQKVPATIISRCQRFDFNRITSSNIIDHVGTVLDAENVSIDDESVKALAAKADGSMRDALSILDQLIAYCGDKITFDDSTVVMGLIPHDTFFNVTKALKAKDAKSIVQLLHETRMLGISAGEMAIGFNKHIRNLLLASVPGALEIYDLNLELKERYELVSKEWDRRDLLRIAEILTDMEAKIHRAAQPYILLEMMCLKLLEMDSTVSLENLLKQLKPSIQSEANDTSAVSQPSVPYKKDPQKSAFVHEVQGKTEDKNPPEELAVSPEAGVKSQKEEAGKESDPVNRNSISLEEVQSAWGEITKKVSASRPSIGTILEHCMINKAHGKVLEVVMTGQPKFNLNLLEKNKKLIEVQVEKSIEKSVILRFKINDKVESISTDSTNNIEEQNENNAPKKDPALLQIIERFDGEIIT
jgi:DNA polymerase-3 subunit gamma/tau